MHENKFYLAIDGGGTKTTAWIADQEGTVVGKGTSGPMSLAATTPEEAVANLLKAIETASEDKHTRFSKVVIGLAGVDTPSEIKIAEELFSTALTKEYEVKDVILVNDVVIALESGAESENAIALISGTGSNCFGKNAKGQTAKTGGMDFLLSDQGSGFEIGQQVLRAAVKSFDGRGQKTKLERLVCEYFEIESINDLKDKVYHPPLNKTEIAKLSQLCFQALAEKDTKANEIIAETVEELVILVETVIKRLYLANEETDLVLVGGIATDPHIRKMLKLMLTLRYPKLHLLLPEHPPVYGALKMAMK